MASNSDISDLCVILHAIFCHSVAARGRFLLIWELTSSLLQLLYHNKSELKLRKMKRIFMHFAGQLSFPVSIVADRPTVKYEKR